MILISDIPKIHTALAEWGACVLYTLLLKRRFSLKDVRFWLITCLALAFFLGIHIGFSYLPDVFVVVALVVSMIGIWFFLYLQCDLGLVYAVFWAARVFMLAEFLASFQWQFYFYLSQTFPVPNPIAFQYILLSIVYFGIFVGVFFLERRYSSGALRADFTVKEILLSTTIAIGGLLLSNFSFIFPGSPLSGQFAAEIFYIRTLVDLCALILLYAQQEQRRWYRNKKELDAVRSMLDAQYQQYNISKENIEYLNRKYHDFKQQIEVIQLEENSEKRNKYLNDLKKAIKIYQAQSNSGNMVLDTILTEKSRYCVERDINFTYVADGRLLGFLDMTDICVIVGNALDNAIESVSQLDDREKRLIKMAIYSQNGSLIFRFENWNEKILNFADGLPESTKANKADHGYGIKSIKYSVERYSGSIDISTEHNWFVLCALIPMPEAVLQQNGEGRNE